MAIPKFISIFTFLCYLSLINNNSVEAFHKIFKEFQSLDYGGGGGVVKELHRTSFHFQPARNWINDPNGPIYYKGVYHLFYQYNPKGALWDSNIVWGHSVSSDMINWAELEPALIPSQPFDINGCWSGSTTILPGNRPIILYTGLDLDALQVQNYAIPSNQSDPFLRKWVKPVRNPLIKSGPGVNASAFRDPTTAWWSSEDRHWRILVGGRRRHRGMAHLYRSRDFINWVKAKHPLHSVDGDGTWECPDFFPVGLAGKSGLDVSVNGDGVKHVLKVSLEQTKYDYYTVGRYDLKMDVYIPDNTSVDNFNGLRYDYGNFYASKSFFDIGKKRRVLWGWSNESDSHQDDINKGWAGIQTIPRMLWLDNSKKQVVQWPIQELETLRGKKMETNNQILNSGDNIEVKGITAAQADIEVIFSFEKLDKAEKFDENWGTDAEKLCSNFTGRVGPFGFLILASKNLEEYTRVFFRIFRDEKKHKVVMCSDTRSSSLKSKLYKPTFAGFVDVNLADGQISLRTLIDHSVVESFGAGGRTCITSRVYPTLAVKEGAHLHVFNNGTEIITVKNLNAWSMNTAVINI